MVSGALEGAVTRHRGSSSVIEFGGPDAACGVWGMEDRLVFGGEPPSLVVEGQGHYHETYAKRDGSWVITSLHLTHTILRFTQGPDAG